MCSDQEQQQRYVYIIYCSCSLIVIFGFQQIEDVKDVPSTYTEITHLTRRSTRILANSVKPMEAATKLSEFSDDDEVSPAPFVETVNAYASKRKTILSKISSISAIVLLPTVFIAMYTLCNKDHCSFLKPPNMKNLSKVSDYIDLFSMLICICYALAIAILNAIPFGGKKVIGLANKQGRLTYVMNGLFITILFVFAVLILDMYKIPVATFVRTKYLQLGVSATILGILLSIYLYIRSFYVPVSALNSQGLTDNAVHNFIVGREVNPRIFGVLDVKMFLLRFSTTGVVSS